MILVCIMCVGYRVGNQVLEAAVKIEFRRQQMYQQVDKIYKYNKILSRGCWLRMFCFLIIVLGKNSTLLGNSLDFLAMHPLRNCHTYKYSKILNFCGFEIFVFVF